MPHSGPDYPFPVPYRCPRPASHGVGGWPEVLDALVQVPDQQHRIDLCILVDEDIAEAFRLKHPVREVRLEVRDLNALPCGKDAPGAMALPRRARPPDVLTS